MKTKSKYKDNYTLIYDQILEFKFKPIGLCENHDIEKYIKDVYGLNLINYTITKKCIIIEKEKSPNIIYLYDKLTNIDFLHNATIDEIEDIIIQDNIKKIKSKRYGYRNGLKRFNI